MQDFRNLPTGRCSGAERFTLAVHGGAVYGRKGTHSQKAALIWRLLNLGRQHLAEGAGALYVVHAAIRSMEDSGLFNADRGAIGSDLSLSVDVY